jgi:hypothetical protein
VRRILFELRLQSDICFAQTVSSAELYSAVSENHRSLQFGHARADWVGAYEFFPAARLQIRPVESTAVRKDNADASRQ